MERDMRQTEVGVYAVAKCQELAVLGVAPGEIPGFGKLPTVLLNATDRPDLLDLPASAARPSDDAWNVRARVTPALRKHGLVFQVEIAEPYPATFSFYLCPCFGMVFSVLMSLIYQKGLLVVTPVTEERAMQIAREPLSDHAALVLQVSLGNAISLAEQLIDQNRYN